MEFPERIANHIKESDSIDILNSKLPSEWIVREITERDYGVDLYLEIVGEDRKVTGNLVALQVKGTRNINFNSQDLYTFSGIKKSTVNYWKGLPVQVFLILVEVEKKDVYWISINRELRVRQFDWSKESISFTFNKEFNLNTLIGINEFHFIYLYEKKWPMIEKAIIECITSFNTFGPLFLYIKRNQHKKYLSAVLQNLVIKYFETFYILSRYLLNKKPEPLPVWYDKHILECKKSNIMSPTFSFSLAFEMLKEIIRDYYRCAEISQTTITNEENDYWKNTYPYIFLLLKEKPFQFILDDWFSRYFFDEYENETDDLLSCIFTDLEI